MIHRRSFITGLVSLVLLSTSAAAFDDDSITGTTSGTMTLTHANTCVIASIADDGDKVTIDWDCVEKNAAKYRGRKVRTDLWPAIAHVLKAIHDGKAASK